MTLPTIGVHTHITNPLSASYLAYLACIESWAHIADDVVVVDGGTTDDSLEMLRKWLVEIHNVRIVSPPEAYWGAGDNWVWPQIAINRQIGLEQLQTDWAVHVDADHVVDWRTTATLRNKLATMSDRLLLQMWIGGYTNGRYKRRLRKRAWILNWSKIRAQNLNVAYGLEKERSSGLHLDYPVYIEEKRSFIDPVNSMLKCYYLGKWVPPEKTIKFDCFKYGHFFFTVDQCLQKCMRIERAIARFMQSSPRSLVEVQHQLRVSEIIGYESQADLLAKNHPPGIHRLIEAFYKEGMLGGAIYRSPGFLEYCASNSKVYLSKLLHLLQRLKRLWGML